MNLDEKINDLVGEYDGHLGTRKQIEDITKRIKRAVLESIWESQFKDYARRGLIMYEDICKLLGECNE